jgi:pyruvate dehydrogenase E1 component
MTHDIDPLETQEWLEALDAIITVEGVERAEFLLKELLQKVRNAGCAIGESMLTPYQNTIPVLKEAKIPGDPAIERRLRSLIRWNAVAMVIRAGRIDSELGGHIGTFASAATLYEVGFNHFFRAPNKENNGDLVYIQGHTAPGIYARSFLEGSLSKEQITHFRREVDGKGVSSYPHPWLMPNYWQFPTVSMGLGPVQAIYQARFMRYMQARGLETTNIERKVWCFCGDGEMDEPESLGCLSLAGREKLDNLIFVINCNLQRLDGPVRGNGHIIQELEGVFKGAGWNVIKVIWGGEWDALFAKDKSGLLLKRMEEVVDGEYQNYKAKGGTYTRAHFFGKYPELKALVADLTDEEIWRLNRGGHDPQKVYAAYKAAVEHKGQPTVILAKTVKGYGLADAGEALNIAHNTKKMTLEQLKAFKERFDIPVPEDKLAEAPFYKPAADSPEIQYLLQRRQALGGAFPARRSEANETLEVPALDIFEGQLKGTGERKISTTMAFVRLLTSLARDKSLGKRIVPIVPDEARTFGMEGLFRQLGIYSPIGQLYEPVDSDQVMYYKEAKDGQILEEGINEAGSFCSWLAAATSYSTHNKTMIPFYIYYSMFGFQRIGDFAWAAGDSRARGFLLGGTAGRTTLNGEGLQHQDGHSHILANTIPNCLTFDPTFSYEVAVIIHDGLRRMIGNKEDVFYYITLMNENYEHPDMPAGAEEGILKGIYCLKKASDNPTLKQRVQLLGSGTILREAIAAATLLEQDFQIAADIWSVTSFNQLGRDGLEVSRWNRLHPMAVPKEAHITRVLKETEGPIIAVTDYMKQYADQLRAFMPRQYVALGTDGFGRSDTRQKLRAFFEVDRYFIAVAALNALADEGAISKEVVKEAIEKYQINSEKPNPCTI